MNVTHFSPEVLTDPQHSGLLHLGGDTDGGVKQISYEFSNFQKSYFPEHRRNKNGRCLVSSSCSKFHRGTRWEKSHMAFLKTLCSFMAAVSCRRSGSFIVWTQKASQKLTTERFHLPMPHVVVC